MKLKVMTILGTRPEIIRLSRVIAKLDLYCEHTLVHTGQNYDYELNDIFFADLSIKKPDFFLNAAGKSGAETIGRVIEETDKILREVSPQAVLLLGDTNSCLAVISAKRLKIPTFHMEAGNRCFDMRVPEEINRRIVDHTADFNLCYSEIARSYLIAEGLSPDFIVTTGSPMYEILEHHRTEIDKSDVLNRLDLSFQGFFLVSAHREENIDSEINFRKLIDVLNSLAEEYELPIILSTHPRTQKRIDSSNAKFHPHIKLMKPVGFIDYNKLQLSSKAVLSDSGTISEESSILNFPALNIREAHERPEAMEEASVIMTGLNKERVLQALQMLQAQSRGAQRDLKLVADYDVPNVSEKVVRLIHSYTDYINQKIWKKF